MIFMAWPLLVILIVLLEDDLLGVQEFDFSSQPELVPSDWESDESEKQCENQCFVVEFESKKPLLDFLGNILEELP